MPSCRQNPATPTKESPKNPPNTTFRARRSTKYCRGSSDSFSNVDPKASDAFRSASNRIERKPATSLGERRRILKEFKEFEEFKEFRSSGVQETQGVRSVADLKVTFETEMPPSLGARRPGCLLELLQLLNSSNSFYCLSLSPLDLSPSDFCPADFPSVGEGFSSLDF